MRRHGARDEGDGGWGGQMERQPCGNTPQCLMRV